jgi:hypothetical protein
VEEVGELNGILDEKNWSIVADHIVVTFFSVEFDGKTSWVSDAIS